MSAEPYKIEILEDILKRDPAAPITVYHVGELRDSRRPMHPPPAHHMKAPCSGRATHGARGR